MFTHQQLGLGLASLLVLACSSDGGDGSDTSGGGKQSGAGASWGGGAGAGNSAAGGGGANATGGNSPAIGGWASGGSGTSGMAGAGSSLGTGGNVVGAGGVGAGAAPSGGIGTGSTSGASTIPSAYRVGGQVTGLLGTGLMLRLNGAIELPITANGNFVFSPLLADGSSYAVTVQTHSADPQQVCTPIRGDGVIAGADISSVVVRCSQIARYSLVVDSSDNTISSYFVDETSGRTHLVGWAATGKSPTAAAVHPSGKYAYVANSGDGTVSQYRIEPSGAISAFPMPVVPSGAGTRAIAVTPSGNYLYATNATDGTVSQYVVEASGALTAKGTVPAGVSPGAIVVHPDENHVYVANSGADSISQFNVANGSLQAMGTPPVLTGTSPAAISLDPSGRYAYVANSGSANISQYRVNRDSGALEPLSTPAVPSGARPTAIAIHPLGGFAYVANGDDAKVSHYKIENGALSALPELVDTDLGPNSLLIDPVGKYVYVGSAPGGTISQFTIGESGRLAVTTPRLSVPRSPTALALSTGAAAPRVTARHAYVSTGDDTLWIYSIDGTTGALTNPITLDVGATSPTAIAVHPTAKFLYIANSSKKSVSQYAIDSSGDITPLNPATAGAGTYPLAIALHPSGKYAYVVNQLDRNISQYHVELDGRLTALEPASVLAAAAGSPNAIVIDSFGRFAYVPMTNGTVSQFSIGRQDGKLAAMATASTPAGTAPDDACVSPDGQFLYVANSSSNNISQYRVGDTGALTPLGTAVASGNAPVAIAIDPSGKYVYAGNATDATISRFAVEKASAASLGTLSALTPATPAGTASYDVPYAMAIDPSGRYAYVVDNRSASGAVWQFRLSPSDGTLTPLSPVSVSTGNYAQSIAVLGASE